MSGSPSLVLPAVQGTTIRVSILNAGRIVIPKKIVVQPPMPGHDILDVPAYSFLIENDRVGQKLLFDLGVMKTLYDKSSPKCTPARLFQLSVYTQGLNDIQSSGSMIEVPADVPDILTAAGVPLTSINAIIWSHHHFDHTGDPSLFPPSTALIVGPGFKSLKDRYPGYPQNPDALTLQDAFVGREVRELDFSAATQNIGGLPALDWFNDGSLYVLEALGHTTNHVMALARTASGKFLLLGGDAAHHAGEFRPTPLVPLPESIAPSPFDAPCGSARAVCPGAIFEHAHIAARASGADFHTTPFYEAATPQMVEDTVAHEATLQALKEFDASPDVLTIIAHDQSLLDVLGFYPGAELNGWEVEGEAGPKGVGRWRFLKYFKVAVEGSEQTKI
ncbi:metallo-beta-lactamase superfamily protein [Gloeopeniophorella convolvens]|nr:metallo-beta-lactamase superfamily protein [Gloeopeniophorella convolvens]